MRRIPSIVVAISATTALIFVALFYSDMHYSSLKTMSNVPEQAFRMMQPIMPQEYSDLTTKKLYLKTMVVFLSGYVFKDDPLKMGVGAAVKTQGTYKDQVRRTGGDWPSIGFTMIGTEGLENIQQLLEDVFKQQVQGDFLEAGVWRGGASIFAKAVITIYDEKNRHVWVCDSFQGLPSATQNKDTDRWSKMNALEVSKETVRNNFNEVFLLDSSVHFQQGYFVYSLPCLRQKFKNSGTKLAVLRADGDMYESLMDILFNLYEFVPVGGYVIIDDWTIDVAKKAVNEFRKMFGINEQIHEFRGMSCFWKVTRIIKIDYQWYKDFLNTRSLDRSKMNCNNVIDFE